MTGASTYRTAWAKKRCATNGGEGILDGESVTSLRQRHHVHEQTRLMKRPAQRDRSCRCGAELSETRPSRWPGSYNARTHRRCCSGTTLHEASFCPGTALVYRLCRDGARSRASLVPNLRRLFEYSWQGSITGRSAGIQVSVAHQGGYCAPVRARLAAVASGQTAAAPPSPHSKMGDSDLPAAVGPRSFVRSHTSTARPQCRSAPP